MEINTKEELINIITQQNEKIELLTQQIEDMIKDEGEGEEEIQDETQETGGKPSKEKIDEVTKLLED